MPRCALHAHLVFTDWKDYDNHVHMFHRRKGETIKPHKDSGRKSGVYAPGAEGPAKGTIVSEAESTWLRPYLVTHESIKREKAIREAEEARQGHPAGCKCFDCVMGG